MVFIISIFLDLSMAMLVIISLMPLPDLIQAAFIRVAFSPALICIMSFVKNIPEPGRTDSESQLYKAPVMHYTNLKISNI